MQGEKDIPETIGEHVTAGIEGAEDNAAQALDAAHDATEAPEELDLDENDRLPWLESADDDYDDAGVDTARLFGFGLAAVAILAALISGIWWLSHRQADPALVADGSVIAAPSEPYKEAPKNPGGKQLAGTGNSSYEVSQGKDPQGQLAGGGVAPKPSVDTGVPGTGPVAAGPAAPTGGVGVQVGAFGSQAAAEAGWARLVGQSAALKGVSHRVVEGSADIGKVYRLQAVAGDEAKANALCASLKSAGIACQVKR